MNKIIDAETWNSLSLQEREQCIKYWMFIGKRIQVPTRDMTENISILVLETVVYRHYDFIAMDDESDFVPYTEKELRILVELM